jgi:ABC-type transport system involved in multi-copper enzyme maturation permease subunit
MNSVLTIAMLTLQEARRRRVVLAGLIFGLGFLTVFVIGFGLIYRDLQLAPAARSIIPPGIGRNPATSAQTQAIFLEFVAMAGLYAVNFLTVMMAVLTPIDTLSGEIQSGAIQSLVTKPARRHEIVLGKWLGFWLLIVAYLLLMAGGVLLSVRVIGGLTIGNPAPGLALMLLEATAMLSLSIAGGTRLSTLANGVMGFGMFGLAFIGGWIEQIGTLVGNATAENVGVVTSLLVPSEAMWRLAAYSMQSPLLRELTFTPFTSASVPSTAMIYWTVGYIAAVLLIGLRGFAKRDL